MWHPRHVRNPRGGEVTVSLFVSHPASLPAFSLLMQTNVRQETRPDFVVMCDQKLVVLVLVLVVLVAMIVIEESVVVGE